MSNNAPDTEALLANLRDKARKAYLRLTIPPDVRFRDVLWAMQSHEAPTDTRDAAWWETHGPRIADLLHRATGLDDLNEAAAVIREAVLAGETWATAVTERMEHDNTIPRELKRDAIPYARRFLLLPDEAVNHVRVLPEQERGRWFFGFWTAPAGWPPLPPSAQQEPRFAEGTDASD